MGGAVRFGGGAGGASVAKLKTALQYADNKLGLDVQHSSYSDICRALGIYFPEGLYKDYYPYKEGVQNTPWTSSATHSSINTYASQFNDDAIAIPFYNNESYVFVANTTQKVNVTNKAFLTFHYSTTGVGNNDTVKVDITDVTGSYYIVLWTEYSSSQIRINASLCDQLSAFDIHSAKTKLTIISAWSGASSGYVLIDNVCLCDAEALVPLLTNNTWVQSSGSYTTESTYVAWHAFDGDDSTYWQSPLSGTSADFIGYRSPYHRISVRYCRFYGKWSGGGRKWYLQYADENDQWVNAGSVTVTTSEGWYTIESSEDNPHWQWRLYCETTTSNWMKVSTMQLYGAEAETDELVLYDNGTEGVQWQTGVATVTNYTNKGGFEKQVSGMVGRVALVKDGNTFISVNTPDKIHFGQYKRLFIETTYGTYWNNCENVGDAYLIFGMWNYAGNRTSAALFSSSKSGCTDNGKQIATLIMDYYAISSGYHDVTVKKVWLVA